MSYIHPYFHVSLPNTPITEGIVNEHELIQLRNYLLTLKFQTWRPHRRGMGLNLNKLCEETGIESHKLPELLNQIRISTNIVYQNKRGNWILLFNDNSVPPPIPLSLSRLTTFHEAVQQAKMYLIEKDLLRSNLELIRHRLDNIFSDRVLNCASMSFCIPPS